MKKIFSTLFISFILILNLFLPVSLLASEPTLEIILMTENENGTTGKWAWGFNINTTNIPNGTNATVSLYKDTVLDGEIETKQIINNNFMYLTYYVLEPDTNYSIVVEITNPVLTEFYEGRTPVGTVNNLIIGSDGSTAIGSIKPPNPPPTTFDVKKDENKNSGAYRLLAPIGKFQFAPDNIGEYFNTIFLLAIGLCAVLAVVMIVIGGIQYMGDESIFGKTEAKDRITKAILGLLIALGSYALLNTINPDLLGGGGVNIKQVTAEIVDLPDAGDGIVDPDFKKGAGSYSSAVAVSGGISNALTKLNDGWVINSLIVSPTNNKMTLSLEKGGVFDNTNTIDISPGSGGYSEIGQGVINDKKTPKGSWQILSIKTSPGSQPVYNKTGSNMGATFWLLNPTTNGERGIGIHGNKTGTLGVTNGCIRLKNSDLLALLPYIKTGVVVKIGVN